MRPGQPGDGGRVLGPPHRHGQHAPAFLGVAQGHHAEEPDRDGARPGPAATLAQAGHPPPDAAAAALRAALGHEPLRGAQGRLARLRDAPRSRGGRAPDADGRRRQPLHRRGAGAHAGAVLPQARGTPALQPAVADGARGRSQARHASADAAGSGAAGLHARGAVLPAVDGGRGAGGVGPRPRHRAGRRLPAAGAAADHHRRGAIVGHHRAGHRPQLPVAGQHLRPPDAAAAAVVREAAPGRHRLALRLDPDHPAQPDHAVRRRHHRRPAGDRHAGGDAGLQPGAGVREPGLGVAVRAAALGDLRRAARGHRRTDHPRVAPEHLLHRIGARHPERAPVPAPGRAPHRLDERAGRAVQRRPAHRAVDDLVPDRQLAADQLGARDRGLARRARGHGSPLHGGHAVRLPELQGAVQPAHRVADRPLVRAAHAGPARRARGRHRAVGAREGALRLRGRPGRRGGVDRGAQRVLPLRRQRALRPRGPEPGGAGGGSASPSPARRAAARRRWSS